MRDCGDGGDSVDDEQVFMRLALKSTQESSQVDAAMPPDIQEWAEAAIGHGFDKIKVHPRSGRNSLWECQEGDRRWLVKQSIKREVANVSFASNAAALPAALAPESGSLLYPLDSATTTIEEIRGNEPLGALRAIADLGPVLRALHALQPDEGHPHAVAPWPALDPVPLDVWLTMTSAARELVKRVQARPHLTAALNALGQAEGNCMVHGDIKPDNIIIRPTNGASVALIDWELGGRGDPFLDIASVLGSLLFVWASGLALSAAASVTEWETGADVPFSAVTSEADRFLQEYGAEIADCDAVWRAAAAWLAGRCWADAMHARELSPRTLVMLAVASRIARSNDVRSV